jgi:hypothetical protein
MDKRISWPEWPPRPNISYSNLNIFQECPRKWFNQYCWSYLPEPEKWQIYTQRNLLPSEALVGSVVDDAITYALVYYIKSGVLPDDLTDIALGILSEYGKFSKRWSACVRSKQKWPDEFFLRPIQRIYFQEDYTREEVHTLKEHIRFCIKNFLKSDILSVILSHPCDTWQVPPRKLIQSLPGQMNSVDEEMPSADDKIAIPWFWYEDIPIYSSYDFMIVTQEEALILDWKTGNRARSELRTKEQLHYYAAFVLSEFAIEPEQIKMAAVWLSDEDCLAYYPYSSAAMENLHEKWKRYFKVFHDLTASLEEGKPWGQLFPLTESAARCKNCPYRACEGYSRVQSLSGQSVYQDESM